jgi:CheY-like chemotaxis protein
MPPGVSHLKTILVFEDEPAVMGIFRRVLKNYAVLEAVTAREALQWHEHHNGHLHLLISDVTLPLSSGVRVALELYAAVPALKVILASGYPPPMWRERDLNDLGELPPDSVAVLVKPFRPAELLRTVHSLIGAPVSQAAANSTTC